MGSISTTAGSVWMVAVWMVAVWMVAVWMVAPSPKVTRQVNAYSCVIVMKEISLCYRLRHFYLRQSRHKSASTQLPVSLFILSYCKLLIVMVSSCIRHDGVVVGVLQPSYEVTRVNFVIPALLCGRSPLYRFDQCVQLLERDKIEKSACFHVAPP